MSLPILGFSAAPDVGFSAAILLKYFAKGFEVLPICRIMPLTQGTSMAARPVVQGSAAIVCQYFAEGFYTLPFNRIMPQKTPVHLMPETVGTLCSGCLSTYLPPHASYIGHFHGCSCGGWLCSHRTPILCRGLLPDGHSQGSRCLLKPLWWVWGLPWSGFVQIFVCLFWCFRLALIWPGISQWFIILPIQIPQVGAGPGMGTREEQFAF